MSDSVIIKSSSSTNELQLTEQEGLLSRGGSEHYRVTLKVKGLVVSAKVYAFEPHNGLSEFLDNLAMHWKGWKDEKWWNSLEGEFTLSCKSDECGHVAIEVLLKSGLHESDWSVQSVIIVDAGQLEEIALKVKKFFSVSQAGCA